MFEIKMERLNPCLKQAVPPIIIIIIIIIIRRRRRLNCVGYVMRREKDQVIEGILISKPDVGKKRGRPKKR